MTSGVYLRHWLLVCACVMPVCAYVQCVCVCECVRFFSMFSFKTRSYCVAPEPLPCFSPPASASKYLNYRHVPGPHLGLKVWYVNSHTYIGGRFKCFFFFMNWVLIYELFDTFFPERAWHICVHVDMYIPFWRGIDLDSQKGCAKSPLFHAPSCSSGCP